MEHPAAAAATSPETLRVRLSFADAPDDAPPRADWFDNSTLAGVLGDAHPARAYKRPLICAADAADGASPAPLRDVLLRRCELPGFGVLPAEWVSGAVRDRVALESSLADAPDLVTLSRVLAQAEAPHAKALILAMLCVSPFMRKADQPPWPPAAKAAAHDLVLRTLCVASAQTRELAVALLWRLAMFSHSCGVWQPAVAQLLPHVLAVLAAAQARNSDDDLEPEGWALTWMYLAVELTRFKPESDQIAADVAAAMHEHGALPLLLRACERELARLAAPAAERTPQLQRVVALLMWQLPVDVYFGPQLSCGVKWQLSRLRAAPTWPAATWLSVTRALLAARDALEAEAAAAGRGGFDATALLFVNMALCAALNALRLHCPAAPAAPELFDALAALAASTLPARAARRLHENSREETRLYVCVTVWAFATHCPAAWPGGAAALAALAADADVGRSLEKAQREALADISGLMPVAAALTRKLRALVQAAAGAAAAAVAAPCAAAGAAASDGAAAATTDALRLRCYMMSISGGWKVAGVFSLAQLASISGPGPIAIDLRVCDAAAPVAAEACPLLRDVVQRAAELPGGCGPLCDDDVPTGLRRRAALEQAFAAAADVAAVWRVLRDAGDADADGHEFAPAFANRTLYLLAAATREAGARLSRPDIVTAHEAALLASQSPHVSAHLGATYLLGELALHDQADAPLQLVLPLLPHIAAALAPVIDHHRRKALRWLAYALHAVAAAADAQLAADVAAATRSCGLVPRLVARAAAAEVAAANGAVHAGEQKDATQTFDALRSCIQVFNLYAHLSGRDVAADCEPQTRLSLLTTACFCVAGAACGQQRAHNSFWAELLQAALPMVASMLDASMPHEAASAIEALFEFRMPQRLLQRARETTTTQPEDEDDADVVRRTCLAVWDIALAAHGDWTPSVRGTVVLADVAAGLMDVMDSMRPLNDDDVDLAELAERLPAHLRALMQATSAAAASAAEPTSRAARKPKTKSKGTPANGGGASAAASAQAVAAAEAAAAALLAEEEAAAAEKRKRSDAKARKAERAAAERRARADAEEAAAAAQKAAEEERAAAAAAEAEAKRAQQRAAAAAASQAAAAAAAAAAQAEQRQRQQAQRDAAARREAAAAAVQQRMMQQQQQQQQAAAAAAPLPPAPAPAEPPRTSDAELAALFPWLGLHTRDAATAPPPPAAPAPPAVATEEDDDDRCCVICLDAPRAAALQPCGHGVLCAACAAKVLATAAPTCPLCRAPAASYTQA